MKKIIITLLLLNSVYNVKCFAQWFQVGQTLRGDYITNISVPDSNTVWISWFDLAYNSKILKTANGGQNWNFVTPPANGYFLTCTQLAESSACKKFQRLIKFNAGLSRKLSHYAESTCKFCLI